MLKLKFTQNLATLDIMNSSLETVIFNPKEMLGILDLRSVSYNKIKQGILQKISVNTTDLNQQTLCVNNLTDLWIC